MSESQQCTDPCLGALDSVEDSEYLKFGTQSFANENIKCKPPAPKFLHNPVGNAICCEVKVTMNIVDLQQTTLNDTSVYIGNGSGL